MRYSPVPVVAAPFKLTLGGGAEVAMGGNAIQAAAELYMGLVEVGVGLIPGGGGNMQLLRNVFGTYAADKDFDALPFLKKVFLTIGTAKVATSAEEAREVGFLSAPATASALNRDFLLVGRQGAGAGHGERGLPPAAAHALPPARPQRRGDHRHDAVRHAAQPPDLRARPEDRPEAGARCSPAATPAPRALVTEQQLLELELEAFLSLCGEEKTQERIMYMLEKGKPLRN